MAAQGRFRFLQRWSSLTAFFAAFRDEVPSLESRDRDLEDYLSKMDDRVVVTETAIVATPVSVPNGGTAIASYAVGDLLYASATTTLSKLAGVATGNALISGGVTTAPSWGKIALNTHTTGTLALGTDTTGDYVASVTGTANQITVTGSGGETAAVILSLPFGTLTSFTPTLTTDGAGADPTNYTGTGKYCRIGEFIIAFFKIQCDASFTRGSGDYVIGALPVARTGLAAIMVSARDNSADNPWTFTGWWKDSTSFYLGCHDTGVNPDHVTQTTVDRPFAFAVDDYIEGFVIYLP